MEEIKKKKRVATVFIDGNNFYHNANASSITPSRVNLYKLALLVCKHFNADFKSAFYYNSVPSIDDGNQLYAKHMAYLNKVKNYPNFIVITRKLQKHSNKEKINEKRDILAKLDLCERCRSAIERNCIGCLGTVKKREKGIDVKISIDMINLCIFKKECNLCILISGDADFIPAMDLVKENGYDAVSAFLPFGYSNQLRQSHGWFILDRELLLKKYME
jgi:uncharacterized LabA/DUF88 family protein